MPKANLKIEEDILEAFKQKCDNQQKKYGATAEAILKAWAEDQKEAIE